MDDALDRAFARREAALAGRVLDAYRLINGLGDDAPAGLTIDRYAGWLVVAAREQLDPSTVEAWARGAADRAGSRGVVLKTLRRPVAKSTSAVLLGDAPPAALPIREDDAVLLCDLDQGLGTGLFLDQREVRIEARRYARDAEVLNLFAYTCAFSVHAARAGATRVTSVDSARRALARGRANMSASGLEPDRHRWFPDDVRTHLARAVRRGDRYGLAILDPPVFGRAGAKVHVLTKELADLVQDAARLVEDGGVLVLSVHALELDAPQLLAAIEGAGRPVEVLSEHGLPAWDHPVRDAAAIDDRGDYLKTLVVRLG